MASVMTVLGPVDAGELGVTLPHEHVFLDLTREYRGDGLLNDPVLAAHELALYAEAGGRTVVDVTSVGLARDPAALRSMAARTGLNIVMGCGFYRRAYFPAASTSCPPTRWRTGSCATSRRASTACEPGSSARSGATG